MKVMTPFSSLPTPPFDPANQLMDKGSCGSVHTDQPSAAQGRADREESGSGDTRRRLQCTHSPLSLSSGLLPRTGVKASSEIQPLGLIPKHTSLGTRPSPKPGQGDRWHSQSPPALGPSLLTLGPFPKTESRKLMAPSDPTVNPVSGPRTYFQTNRASESHTSGLSLLPLISKSPTPHPRHSRLIDSLLLPQILIKV